MRPHESARAEKKPSTVALSPHPLLYSRPVLGAGPAARLDRSYLIPLLLFTASAAFTLWRNTEVGVLVDIAYVLNIGTRIAAGDVPYAQFPLAQAPLEFLVQALLIRVFGPHYVVQIVYATILGGLATALTYTIARRLLEGAVAQPRVVATILAVPLIPLGIYAIYPHPFYDPDACLVILLGIAAIFVARDRPTRVGWLLAGALLAVPVFLKQNIGGAFLVLIALALGIEALWRAPRRAGFRWCLAGLTGGLSLEILALHLVAGIDNYVRWAWTFALSGRGVTTERLREFADLRLLIPAILVLLLVLASQRLAPLTRAAIFGAGLGLFAIWVALASTLVGAPLLFPSILVAASALGLARATRDGPSFETLLPLVLTGTTLGTLQSQGLAGSTFGIFPLLVVALASIVRDLAFFVDRPLLIAPLAGVVVALVLTVSGGIYTLTNVRLLFVDVNAPGPVARSTFPSLAGLSARGPYIGELDMMLNWAHDNVPPDDAVVFLPGEDPAFYALGWRPRLPSVYFYDVATPYSPAELARIANEVGLRWVFVKDRLQLADEPPLEKALVAALTERATLVAQVGPYRVFKR